jgi:hypothetical protein
MAKRAFSASDRIRLAGASKERKLMYLNQYQEAPRFRIETSRGGSRCLWKAITSRKKMEETRAFIVRCWGE